MGGYRTRVQAGDRPRTGTTFEETTVGGLSSITYDAKRDRYYAISDDQGQFQPTRFYTLGLDIRDGRLADGDGGSRT